MAYQHSKNRPLLGIDVSSAAVKVLELSRRGSRFRVEAYAVEPLADGAVVDSEIRDTGAVSAAVGRCVKRSGTKLKRCAMAMPSTAVITKAITMPAGLGSAELEGQVFVEADQHIPYALEEVNLDFHVVGQNPHNQSVLDVLVVASRRDSVNSRIAVAEGANLELEILDVESFAIERTAERLLTQIPNLGDDDVAIVVDAGAATTSIYAITRRSGVLFTREQVFGGRMLTDAVMRRYEMTYQQAGAAKIAGNLPEDYVPEVLEPFRQSLVDQIHRLMQFFFLQEPNATVSHILLGGGCAAIPGIDEQVQVATGTTVSIANPFREMATAGRINRQRFANDAPALLTCCGLGLRGVVA